MNKPYLFPKETTVTSKRAMIVMSVLGMIALSLPAQTPTGGTSPQQPNPLVPAGGARAGAGMGGGFGGGGGLGGGMGLIPQGGGFGGGPMQIGMSYGMSPEEAQLAHQCDSLVRELAKAEGAEKDKLKAKLTEAIDKQFDLRQKRHETEIASLESQLKKLKDMVQKRQENRKDIVGKRLEQLVRDSEGLGW